MKDIPKPFNVICIDACFLGDLPKIVEGEVYTVDGVEELPLFNYVAYTLEEVPSLASDNYRYSYLTSRFIRLSNISEAKLDLITEINFA